MALDMLSSVTDPTSPKAELRREMRAVRRAVADQPGRSERLWARVESLDAVRSARTVMAFDSIDGEPITAPFIERCLTAGKAVVKPEDDPPPDPAAIDVVVVPGIAFTERGDRLGQGGGWYDRFLGSIPANCATIGVGFESQMLDELPTEPHDIRVDVVVTERCVRHADAGV